MPSRGCTLPPVRVEQPAELELTPPVAQGGTGSSHPALASCGGARARGLGAQAQPAYGSPAQLGWGLPEVVEDDSPWQLYRGACVMRAVAWGGPCCAGQSRGLGRLAWVPGTTHAPAPVAKRRQAHRLGMGVVWFRWGGWGESQPGS